MTETYGLPIDTIVQLTMYLVLAFYVIYSGVFYYHWKSYATDKKVTNLTLSIYLLTTIPLALVLAGLAFII